MRLFGSTKIEILGSVYEAQWGAAEPAGSQERRDIRRRSAFGDGKVSARIAQLATDLIPGKGHTDNPSTDDEQESEAVQSSSADR